MARSRALRAAQQLDEHWYHLRIRDTELQGKHMLRIGAIQQPGPVVPAHDASTDMVTLSEVVAIYLRPKGKGCPITFHRAAERSCGYVIDVCGDKAITSYTRADANAFRDALVSRELAGSSITRVFGTVRSIISFVASEVGVTLTNPFAGVYYDRKAGVEDRKPLPLAAIRQLQGECTRLDDDLRWLVAMLSDTGMRLAEAAGLHIDDIKLDAPLPHVVVQEHPAHTLPQRKRHRLSCPWRWRGRTVRAADS